MSISLSSILSPLLKSISKFPCLISVSSFTIWILHSSSLDSSQNLIFLIFLKSAYHSHFRLQKIWNWSDMVNQIFMLSNIITLRTVYCWNIFFTSKATVNDARYKVSRIVKLVEIAEIKVDCHFYFYYALVGLYSANFFC